MWAGVTGTEPFVGFGDFLRGYRRAAGLTQERLAKRAGVSPRSTSEMDRRVGPKRPGRSAPAPDNPRHDRLELRDARRAGARTIAAIVGLRRWLHSAVGEVACSGAGIDQALVLDLLEHF